MEAIENSSKLNIKFTQLCRAYKEFLTDVRISETEAKEIELMLLEADLDEW